MRLPWGGGQTVMVTCWENCVAACTDCNWKKADRTPEQAGLRLRWLPHAPTPMDVLRMTLIRMDIPEEWDDYLPVAQMAPRGSNDRPTLTRPGGCP